MLQRKAVFFKLQPHPVFSIDYLSECFKMEVQKYSSVQTDVATCFTPVRNFFIEHYLLSYNDLPLMYHLFPMLYNQEMIVETTTLNIQLGSDNNFSLPTYTKQDVDDKINYLYNQKK
jgi:hypothetical protein